MPECAARLLRLDQEIWLHCEDELRTVLWGFRGRPWCWEALRWVRSALDGVLGVALTEYATPGAEMWAVRERTDRLLITVGGRTVGAVEACCDPRDLVAAEYAQWRFTFME